MENNIISWDTLPSGEIFKRYVGGDSQIIDLFENDPFDTRASHSLKASKAIDPKKRADLLLEYNSEFEISQEQKANIERLSSTETACVITGQQLTFLGGPLYTFFKIITTIVLARKLTISLGRHVVPVFWLADEDHDFEEISRIYYPKGSGVDIYSIQDVDRIGAPVSDLEVANQIEDDIREIFEGLGQTEFSTNLIELISGSYKKGYTHRKAFGTLISRLFGKHGLVLTGSHHPSIKKAFTHLFLNADNKPSEIESSLKKQTTLVEKISKPQAQVSDSVLFYLDPQKDNQRVRIKRQGKIWQSGSNTSWTNEELRVEILDHPERFSPNVFLRPILQDTLLPNLAYVAGPGEIGYYAQMKTFYSIFDQKMPLIYPRHSATLIEPGIARLMSELPFSFQDYLQRSEVLEKMFLSSQNELDTNTFSRRWTSMVREQSKPFIEEIAGYDASLEASAQKVMADFQDSVDRLTQKLVRSVKQKEQTSLNRISRVKTALFPNDGLQERSICGIYFMNKYGLDIWDRLINHFEMLETDVHHLIKL